MAQLIVRKLEEEVVAELRKRAARNGRSVEAEHREILRRALGRGGRSRSLKDLLTAMPDGGRDEDFRRRPARRTGLTDRLSNDRGASPHDGPRPRTRPPRGRA